MTPVSSTNQKPTLPKQTSRLVTPDSHAIEQFTPWSHVTVDMEPRLHLDTRVVFGI